MTDYTLRQVLWSMKTYCQRKSDIPAPADLIAVLEEGRKVRIEEKKSREAMEKKAEMPWETKARKAREMKAEYVRVFASSPRFQPFVSDKQKMLALTYVSAAASFQAETIMEVTRRTVNWMDLLCDGGPDDESFRADIFREADDAKQRGSISVTLPARLFERANLPAQQSHV
ncbi:MAG: hypothetical protein K2Q12_07990 [Rickettsiales bacterium]|nr:hypothetical protein [Rickettsiales bacterium]